MSRKLRLSTRAVIFRQAIAEFIAERQNSKLKGLSEEKAAELKTKYHYHSWLDDAARRVAQIHAVTHVLKAIHPDARGSSLYVAPESLPDRPAIGTHKLGSRYEEDIVGNAAALDVYKFLKIQVEDKRLLDWLQVDDADLLAAFNTDMDLAQQWATAFKGLTQQTVGFSSHTTAKQLYWCVSNEPAQDENFHLLQPLFPSSLVHAVYVELSNARFGEANKEARRAYFEKKALSGIYRNYTNLSVRKLGGTKPQNISQLNSERRGLNYLLSSSPPIWKNRNVNSYLGTSTVLRHFRRFEGVNSLIKGLVDFMKSAPPATAQARKKREHIEQVLGQELANFGCSIRTSNIPGWTRNTECVLPSHEQIWLDPERAELPVRPDFEEQDLIFRRAQSWGDWPDQVAEQFAFWLNDILRKQDLPVGDNEFKHWTRQAIIDASWPISHARKGIENGEQMELAND